MRQIDLFERDRRRMSLRVLQALLVLVLYPIVWLLSLPFRLIGVSVSAVFDLLESLIRLPGRLLGSAR